MPQKKYVVDLTVSEKLELEKLLKHGKHQSRKLTRFRCQKSERTITINSRQYHEAMQTARHRQNTDEFKMDYQKRSGIEGTISQGARAFGLRKARYRGLAETALQHYATAAAMNIARLGAW